MRLFSLLLLFVFSIQTQANQIYIEVGEAQVKKSLIAIPPFQFFGSKTLNRSYLKTGQELFSTVKNNMDVSAYFRIVGEDAYLEDVSKTSLRPKSVDKNGFTFDSWQTLGTDFLVRGGFSFEGNKLFFEAYLYHVTNGKLIFGKKYEGDRKALRKIAHKFSNDVLEKLTGKRGMFESRFVVARNSGTKTHKEIFVLDWDGKNQKQITYRKSIAISPAWSDDGKTIAYTAYTLNRKTGRSNANLFLYSFDTRKHKIISARNGINSGAAFFPNVEDILLTISKAGTPDIYRIDRVGKIKERLTRGPASSMNVEPAVSPDGKKVAFSSDRSGRPMIYVMDIKKAPGKKRRTVKRVVFAGWYNSTPTWSPDSKRLAFAGFDKTKKNFDIFLMDADGTNLSRLTTALKVNQKYSNNEDPTFSPDGRHVAFISDRTGKKQIYMVDVDGSNERRLTFDRNNYFKPKWSKNFN